VTQVERKCKTHLHALYQGIEDGHLAPGSQVWELMRGKNTEPPQAQIGGPGCWDVVRPEVPGKVPILWA
jgi:hypothetical protein